MEREFLPFFSSNRKSVQRKTLTDVESVYNGVNRPEGGGAMITKIRTNIFLTRVQQKKLKALSKKSRAPVAAIVRMAIDEYLKKNEIKS